jgi:DNA-binding LacI/PurR family transcriptional regulator
MAQLIHAGYPMVLIDRYLRDVISDYVISDNFGGALRATQHLIQLGHEHIGFVSWRDPAVSIEHRIAGYKHALVEANLPYDPALTCEIEAYPVIEANHLCTFLTEQPQVTAIFAANDQIALAIYKAVRKKGIRIPEDLALVGFDNLDFTSHLDIPLTTVAQSADKIGEVAVEVLLQRIRHEVNQWQQIILPTQLIVRRSCGAHLKTSSPN